VVASGANAVAAPELLVEIDAIAVVVPAPRCRAPEPRTRAAHPSHRPSRPGSLKPGRTPADTPQVTQFFLLDRPVRSHLPSPWHATKASRPGIPDFFEATLDRAAAGENDSESPYTEYLTSFSAPALTMVCKHRKLTFDYETRVGEFIVSERFWRAADGLVIPAHRTKPVALVSTKGVSVTDRAHLVLRLLDKIPAVDTERSTIEPSSRHPKLTVTKHLVLDPAVVGDLDLFMIADATLGSQLFCSQRFRDAALADEVAVAFIPEASAAETYVASINPLASNRL
jgi:hypothetical protein